LQVALDAIGRRPDPKGDGTSSGRGTPDRDHSSARTSVIAIAVEPSSRRCFGSVDAGTDAAFGLVRRLLMTTHEAQGRTLLTAVERVLASDPELLKILAEERRHGAGTSTRIVSRFSYVSAIAGAIAGAPSIVPGWGLVGTVATTVAEMTYVLKTEVEMCLVLAAHNGLDITNREHRQIAFLLAAVGTHEASASRGTVVDAGAIGLEALWNYSPRQVSKLVLDLFGILALAAASKMFGKVALRALPLVGVVAGAGVNKVLTTRVGHRAIRALRLRPRQ
jgi:hypothetical protein